jgi:shikimate 5-dehydrogenase
VDGVTMLVGQARAAFEVFFGRPAPAGPVQALASQSEAG